MIHARITLALFQLLEIEMRAEDRGRNQRGDRPGSTVDSRAETGEREMESMRWMVSGIEGGTSRA